MAEEKRRLHERRLFLIGKFDSHPDFRLLWRDEMSAVDEESFRMKLELDERKRTIILENANNNTPAAITNAGSLGDKKGSGGAELFALAISGASTQQDPPGGGNKPESTSRPATTGSDTVTLPPVRR